MGSRIRSFIAIELSAGQRRSLTRVIRQMAAQWPEYRWVATDQLHVTLNFLGEVPDEKIPQVCEIMREVAAAHTGFSFQPAGLGAFPKNRRPRVLWTGIDEGKSRLSKIHYDLAEALEGLRLDRERKGYRPHVTLGRIRNDSRWPDSVIEELEAGPAIHVEPADVEQLVLFASYQERGGNVYTVMDRAPLKPYPAS